MERRAVLVLSAALVGGAIAGLFVTVQGPADASRRARDPEPAADLAPRPRRARPDELERLDRQIEAGILAAEQREDDWLTWSVISAQYVERARLSGEFEDYARADRAMARAFAIAPEGAGPFLSRAALHATLHRFDRAEDDLGAAEGAAVVLDADRARIRAMRADVAFHRGDYALALALYDAQLAAGRSVETLIPRAQYAWSTADFAEAEALLDEARRIAIHRGARRYVCLARTTMERARGRAEAALAELARCREDGALEAALADEEIAAVRLELGQIDAAQAAYLDLAARPGGVEAMDQLARIARARGDGAEFERWRDAARGVHEARLALLPEAARGHALRHYLELEDDPARAVALAEADRAVRGGGETVTLLALAYLRAGRIADAIATIDALLETPWSTGAAHATASLAHATAGDAERAARERARAEAIAPGASERVEALLR